MLKSYPVAFPFDCRYLSGQNHIDQHSHGVPDPSFSLTCTHLFFPASAGLRQLPPLYQIEV